MSGVLANRLPPHVLGRLALGQLGQVLGELPLGVPPGEVGVRLRVAPLGQPAHDLRAGERLGQEDRVGMPVPDFLDDPVPEPERLGVGVVDPEDRHAVADPVEEDVAELGPERLPVGALEVDGIDVLVLLGRVLGVLDRAVGPVPEPLGVLLDVGMVGRALEGDVQRDLDAQLAGLRHQAVEILDRPELGVDRLVPPLGAADGPGAARVVRARGQGVVRPLAEGAADRVDRGQVEHVEAHLRDIGQPRLDVAERAVPAPLGRRRPREHLVPGAEPGPLTLDHHAERLVIAGGTATVRMARHPLGQVALQSRPHPRRLVVRPGQEPGPLAEPVGVLTRRPPDRLADVLGPLQQLAGEVLLAGLVLLDQLLVPGGVAVDPGLDRVLVPALGGDREPARPAVVDQQGHRHLGPVGGPGGPVPEHRHDHVVAVGEDVGRHHHLLADRPLDREPAAVDLGRDPFDDHPGRCLLVRRAWLRVRLFRLDLRFRRHDSPSAAAPSVSRGPFIEPHRPARSGPAGRALIPQRASQILARGRIVSRAIVTRIDHGDGQAGSA